MSAATKAEPPAALEGLAVRYGKVVALDGLTLTVEPGAVYALLGRNGAGKSSAVRCLLGQQRPQAGRARLFGLDAWRHRAAAMLRTGVVPEEPDAPPAMSARALAAFCARLYPRWDAAQVSARLGRFGVPGDVPFRRLSKGQKAQVMLALALGHSPELLVLDDPTLGLDALARREFFETLAVELADRGTSVLLTSHDLAGVERMATRVGVLKGGRLVLDEELEALKGRFRQLRLRRPETGELPEEVAVELQALGAAAQRQGAFGLEVTLTEFAEPAFARLRGRATRLAPEVAAMSLEDIFAFVAGESEGAAP